MHLPPVIVSSRPLVVALTGALAALLVANGAGCRMETAPWNVVRWIRPKNGGEFPPVTLPTGAREARDALGARVALLPNQWGLTYFESKNPDLEISALPFR